MLSFIYKFHFILYSVIQWDKERERLRVWERVRHYTLEGGPDCRRKQRAPLTGAEAEAQSDEPMIDLPFTGLRCWSSICDERRPGERRRGQRARCGDVTVRGLLGLVLVLVCVLGIFFFLINTSVLCVWFAAFTVFGLLLYWGLISLPTTTRRDGILPGASDVMGSISDSLYFFFLGWESVGLPWASYL